MREDRLKLCIFLTDPMQVLYAKGEIKPRYYNPDNLFAEVHMLSFSNEDIDTNKVQITVGSAQLHIHCIGRMNLFNLFFIQKKISALLKGIRPDLIRAYDISVRGALACYSAKKLKIPCAISLHNNFDEERKYDKRLILQFRRLLEHYSLVKCDMVICVSDYLRRYARKYNVKKACVIYNRVNLDQFVGMPKKTIQEDEPLKILSVGRLVRQKNHECLLRAIKDLNVKLTLIGNGYLYKHLKRITEKMGIVHKVEFILTVPHQEIDRYYRQADIFALSTHYEGFCIPIIEAMAAGLPIVASNLEIIVEITDECSYLCKNNPADFKKAIESLIENPQLRLELAQKARNRVNLFDSIELENREKEAYRELLNITKR